MGYVPTSNLSALYSSTSPGQVANGPLFNPALQDIVNAVNENFDAMNGLISSGNLSKLGVINVKDYGAKGDGIADDTIAIQNAVNTGHDILFPTGTYLIGDVEITEKHIRGSGTIKKKNSSSFGFIIKGDGTVIDGLTFDAQGTDGQPNWDIKLSDGSSNVTIQNCRFISPTYSAIAAADEGEIFTTRVNGVTISNNYFYTYARPVFLLYVDNATIVGNIFKNTSYDAIRLRDNTGYVLINGNQFIDIGFDSPDDGQTKDAVDAYWSGVNLTITNNIVRRTKSIGFDIKGIAPDGSYGTRKVVIADNQLYQTLGTAINVFGDSDYDGAGNFGFADSILIHDNIIEECNYGNISGAGSISEAGIFVKGLAKYVNIHDNIAIYNYGKGFHIINTVAGQSANKSIIIHNNMAINNGVNGVTGSNGFHISGIDGLIFTGNIAENDTSLPKPYQDAGIYFASNGAGYTPSKSAIIDKNVARNNLSFQILIDANNTRADNIVSFMGNVQVGTGAVNRASWQNERSIFWGNTTPVAGDGTFRQGDIIFNIGAAASGFVGWVCVASGQPGTWKTFGAISA